MDAKNAQVGDVDYLAPAVGDDGRWGAVGGFAVAESLRQGNDVAAMELLRSMDAPAVADVLREVGFAVDENAIGAGWDAVVAGIQDDLGAAAELRVDGFELTRIRAQSVEKSFAAKKFEAPVMRVVSRRDPASEIQAVLHSANVGVNLLGGAGVSDRAALLFVAGQALQHGIQGFGFEGIEGKYQVPLSMADVRDLHHDAAVAVAEESTRTALGAWVNGGKVGDLNELVPDTVQRLLLGSVSVAAVEVVVQAIESGSIANHAGALGEHEYTRLLRAQGFDLDAKTVAEQAEEQGLTIVEVNRERGRYFGVVVGVDHRASLVKFSRDSVVELPFTELAEGQNRPKMGDSLDLTYKRGVLVVSSVERGGREGAAR